MSEPKKAKFAVDQFAKQVFGQSILATKASNSLPDRDDISSLAVTAPATLEQLKQLQNRLVDLINQVSSKKGGRTFSLSSKTVDEVFEHVVDASDRLLEEVDRTVDKLNGITSVNLNAIAVTKDVKATTVLRAANILRPQLRFVPPVDNSAAVAFVPHLAAKPNAIVPLADLFKPDAGRESESAISSAMRGHLTARLSSGGAAVPNPYEAELQALEFGPEQLNPGPERLYNAMDSTPCEWIDTVAALEILVGKLLQEKEIAIDLEQHFFRSYQGFVCLMQLSTRTQNFLVDTLELRASMQKLNVVFTHPKIVKARKRENVVFVFCFDSSTGASRGGF